MLTALFIILMFAVFGKLILLAFKASWGILKVLLSVCSLSNLFFRFHTTTLTEACSNELKQHHL